MWKSTGRSLNRPSTIDIVYRCGFYVPNESNMPQGVIPIFSGMDIYQNKDNTFTIDLYGAPEKLHQFMINVTQNMRLEGCKFENNCLTFTANAELMKQFVSCASFFDNSMCRNADGSYDFSFINSIKTGIDEGAAMGVPTVKITTQPPALKRKNDRPVNTSGQMSSSVLTPILQNFARDNRDDSGEDDTPRKRMCFSTTQSNG